MALDVGIRKVVQENINKPQIEKRDLMISFTDQGNMFINAKDGSLIKITDIIFINNEDELKTVERLEHKIYINLENGLFYVFNKLSNKFISSMDKIKDTFTDIDTRLTEQEKWKKLTDSMVKLLMTTSNVNSKNITNINAQIKEINKKISSKVINFALNNVTKKGQLSAFVFLEIPNNKTRIKITKVLIQLDKPTDVKVGAYSTDIGAVNDEVITESNFEKSGVMYKLNKTNDVYLTSNKNIYIKVNEIGKDEVNVSAQVFFEIEEYDGHVTPKPVPVVPTPEEGKHDEGTSTDKPETQPKPVGPTESQGSDKPGDTTEHTTSDKPSEQPTKPVEGELKPSGGEQGKPVESTKDKPGTETTGTESPSVTEKPSVKPDGTEEKTESTGSETSGPNENKTTEGEHSEMKDTEPTDKPGSTGETEKPVDVSKPNEEKGEESGKESQTKPATTPKETDVKEEKDVIVKPIQPVVKEEKTNQTDFKNPAEPENENPEVVVAGKTETGVGPEETIIKEVIDTDKK